MKGLAVRRQVTETSRTLDQWVPSPPVRARRGRFLACSGGDAGSSARWSPRESPYRPRPLGRKRPNRVWRESWDEPVLSRPKWRFAGACSFRFDKPVVDESAAGCLLNRPPFPSEPLCGGRAIRRLAATVTSALSKPHDHSVCGPFIPSRQSLRRRSSAESEPEGEGHARSQVSARKSDSTGNRNRNNAEHGLDPRSAEDGRL
jgi:hypothetical protein